VTDGQYCQSSTPKQRSMQNLRAAKIGYSGTQIEGIEMPLTSLIIATPNLLM
jgi:hypothetical protein